MMALPFAAAFVLAIAAAWTRYVGRFRAASLLSVGAIACVSPLYVMAVLTSPLLLIVCVWPFAAAYASARAVLVGAPETPMWVGVVTGLQAPVGLLMAILVATR